MNLPFALPDKSLDMGDFISFFDWSNCPYLEMYSDFHYFRYRNQARNTNGEIADNENAILGSLTANYYMSDNSIINELSQMKSKGSKIKAALFTDLNTLIDQITFDIESNHS